MSSTAREWIVGRFPLPGRVADTPDAELVVLLETAQGLMLDQNLVAAANVPSTAVAVVRKALAQTSPDARPSRIRVADAVLAEALRASTLKIPVACSPTPELTALGASLETFLARPAAESGEPLSDEVMQAFFASARALWAAKPWDVLFESNCFHVQAPTLGVDRACLTAIGSAGQSRGILLFPSVEGLDAFLDAGARHIEEKRRRRPSKVDLGGDFLSLEFVPTSEVPPAFRNLVETAGWPVADDRAFPVAEKRARDGRASVPSGDELTFLSHVAYALGAFTVRHGRGLRDEDFVASETITTGDGPPIRLTLPFDAADEFEPLPEAAPQASARARVGRNEPCPCGSGKKYKKCHLEEDKALDRVSRPESADNNLHEELLDAQLILAIETYGEARFGSALARVRYPYLLDAMEGEDQLLTSWLIYDARVEGRRLAEWFLEERGEALPKAKRAWLQAQLGAWLSVWRVAAHDGSARLVLEDLLTGEVRSVVVDVAVASSVDCGDAILARVIDFEGRSLLSGVHPEGLGLDVSEVLARIRKRLRRTSTVSVERLRAANIDGFILRTWNDVLAIA